MDRIEALDFLKHNLKNKNLLNHCFAVEAVMRELAGYFGEDEEKWALAGLLHDIDYEETKDDPAKHSIIGAEMLERAGLTADICYAVKVHNDYHGLPHNSKMDKALFCSDPVTGLIVAGALIRPEKKLEAVDVESLQKRFKEKAFAKGANRETIASCSELDLSLEEFLELSLKAMKKIAPEIGL